MVVNSTALLQAAPIKNMLSRKVKEHGVSHGLAEVGYDIRVKQEVRFRWHAYPAGRRMCVNVDGRWAADDRFTIASAMEEFQMPTDLVGIVHDKSTWARRGLSVFNTVIEPGWRGFLTLELVYHGQDELVIPAGAGIAQVVFHRLELETSYQGKYQDQQDRPIPPILET